MTNVEKLKKLGILDVIRERNGAKDGKDDQADNEINMADNSELVGMWAGWYLGDSYWWNKMKGIFDELEEMK